MIKNTVKSMAPSSAATMASQIPSRSKIIGSSTTAQIWQTKVRTKEITAEIRPLLSAVNRELPKILKPQSKNDSE